MTEKIKEVFRNKSTWITLIVLCMIGVFIKDILNVTMWKYDVIFGFGWLACMTFHIVLRRTTSLFNKEK